ncbi:hypothetical protein FAF44_49370 [Nonomuraea sp. MG754425]|uniref:DUF3592 domain-containing protein n=1 Tax=Nonomuraea sp. MG754425 TaxID=2570319 RepID=UPI001F185828|nr:DUF3592 domain-containing protein [Nonomuraea sp. MG754425]MCF6476300.1 hypothetical protein [Nonomuraea sp. MG754425]
MIGAVVDDSSQRFVIAFTDRAGHHIEFAPQVAGIGLRLNVGQQVPIAYLDGQPQAARVFTARYRVLPSVLSGMAGLIFLGAGSHPGVNRPDGVEFTSPPRVKVIRCRYRDHGIPTSGSPIPAAAWSD